MTMKLSLEDAYAFRTALEPLTHKMTADGELDFIAIVSASMALSLKRIADVMEANALDLAVPQVVEDSIPREAAFGVPLFKGDRCFYLSESEEPREATIVDILEGGKLKVQLDDGGPLVECFSERITLSFALMTENEERRAKNQPERKD